MRLRATTLVVLGLALVATAAAAWATQAAHDDGEERLLDQRLDEAAVVLAGLVPRLTAPLAAAAELAEATEGGRASFERVLSPQVGPDAPFVSVSLWSLAEPDQPVTVVGDQPVLADQGGGETAAFLERSAGTDDVTVIGLLEGPSPVIGLSYTSSTREPTFVIYAEAPVPEDRTAVRQEDALFADLDYALYLGEEASTANLLGTSRELPLPAPTASATVPFGDRSLRLVVHPRGDLMGGLSARLPWVTAVLGLVLGLVLAVLTERLGRRRRRAEALAQDNARLYTEQRSVAHTVQHSLLPVIPACPDGLEIATYYQPGVDGTEVGGDWYDVVDLPGGGLLVVVGDVAGRGLRAATVMALLRHATRAYAADGDGPEVILPKLTRLLDREGVSAFATMLCLELDPSHDHVRVVNAGHPRALLITGEERTFLDTPVGPPVGVRSTKPYPVTRYDLPAAATLLAFTDGLVERRGESVDAGMERLRSAVHAEAPLSELLTTVVDDLTGSAANDDIAVVGLRWAPSEVLTPA